MNTWFEGMQKEYEDKLSQLRAGETWSQLTL